MASWSLSPPLNIPGVEWHSSSSCAGHCSLHSRRGQRKSTVIPFCNSSSLSTVYLHCNLLMILWLCKLSGQFRLRTSCWKPHNGNYVGQLLAVALVSWCQNVCSMLRRTVLIQEKNNWGRKSIGWFRGQIPVLNFAIKKQYVVQNVLKHWTVGYVYSKI